MGNLNLLILGDFNKQVTKAVGNKSVLMWNDNVPIYIVSAFKYPLICPLKTKIFSTHNQIIPPFAAFILTSSLKSCISVPWFSISLDIDCVLIQEPYVFTTFYPTIINILNGFSSHHQLQFGDHAYGSAILVSDNKLKTAA